MTRKPTSIVGRCLKKFKRLLWLILLPLGLGVYWYWANLPVDRADSAGREFGVPAGQATTVIARRLKQEQLIRSALVFRIEVKLQGLDGRLQAGEFRLNRSMDLPAIITRLTRGSEDYWITFPEGWRTEEYAARLEAEAGISAVEFILAAKPGEGRLFPDTYLLPKSASAADIAALLTETFSRKSPVQDRETLIIASLVEREARHAEDRRLVASVIYNRLKIGMVLQIDATVQYALGRAGNWWPQDLTRENLAVVSDYNTYLNPGLPPAPIANPGLASLQAAQNPAQTDYLYYLSDRSGYNHYARTLAEHQANIEQYLND